MARNSNLTYASYEANGNLSTYQFRFVKINSLNRVGICGDGEEADGVLHNKPSAAGYAATVAMRESGGRTKIVAGGAFSIGDQIASDASGRAVVAATGDAILGIAEEAATTANDVITLRLQTTANTFA